MVWALVYEDNTHVVAVLFIIAFLNEKKDARSRRSLADYTPSKAELTKEYLSCSASLVIHARA
jgi:hypothetical protein